MPATFQCVVIEVFFKLLHLMMAVFIDDFSTQTTKVAHLEALRDFFVKCTANIIALNPSRIYPAVVLAQNHHP